jgi:hypothetical protein
VLSRFFLACVRARHHSKPPFGSKNSPEYLPMEQNMYLGVACLVVCERMITVLLALSIREIVT